MKKIFPLLLFSMAAVVSHQKTAAQQTPADTSYYLFFHKGQKVKNNVLLTPESDSVIFNPTQKK